MKDRRDLLKGLAVGSAWATPIVSSVVLPLHAETSLTFPCSAGVCEISIGGPPSLGLVLLDGTVSVIGGAAGCPEFGGGIEGSALINSDGSFEITTSSAGEPNPSCEVIITGTITKDCSSVSIMFDGAGPYEENLDPTTLNFTSCLQAG